MKTYLEIKVPIRYDAHWFDELRTKMKGTQVKWQQEHYHITMAFCDKTPDVDLRPILRKHLNNALSPTLCFDRLDVFEGLSGMNIIHLGVSNIPIEFSSLVENIRNDLKAMGCVMKADFKLHVTLGRLKDPDFGTSRIKEITDSITLPEFSLKLTDVDYKVFGTRQTIFETKL